MRAVGVVLLVIFSEFNPENLIMRGIYKNSQHCFKHLDTFKLPKNKKSLPSRDDNERRFVALSHSSKLLAGL